MKRMNHVLLYGNYEEVFRMMPDAQVGQLIIAMLHYLNTGEESELPGIAKTFWPLIRDQVNRNMEKYEEVCKRNRNNAQKFWDKQKKENENATGTGSE